MRSKSKSPREEAKGGSHRLARVAREIRDVVGVFLINRFRAEVNGILSVTRVVMSADLRTAKVLMTLIPHPDAAAEPLTDELGRVNTKAKAKLESDRRHAVAELNAVVPEVQREIADRLGMRFTPKIHFMYDTGFEHAIKVEGILRQIEMDRKLSSSEEP